MQKAIRNQKGFTLIELIVVVAILGILAVLLTPKLLTAIDNARINSAVTSAQEIQTAMERYLIDNHSYPPASTGSTPWDPLYNATPGSGKNNGSLIPYLQLQATNSNFTWSTYVPLQSDNKTTCAVATPQLNCTTYTLTIKANDGGTTTITITPQGVTYTAPTN